MSFFLAKSYNLEKYIGGIVLKLYVVELVDLFYKMVDKSNVFSWLKKITTQPNENSINLMKDIYRKLTENTHLILIH